MDKLIYRLRSVVCVRGGLGYSVISYAVMWVVLCALFSGGVGNSFLLYLPLFPIVSAYAYLCAILRIYLSFGNRVLPLRDFFGTCVSLVIRYIFYRFDSMIP